MLWIIIAAVLVIVGAVLFTGVMVSLNWDFSRLGTVKYETNTHTVGEEFQNVNIVTQTAEVVFLPSPDGECRIVCHEDEKQKHTVSTEGETLNIVVSDARKWYEYIGISWGMSKITVYLPNTEYGALCVKGSTGDVKLTGNFVFDSVDVASSTGDVELGASVNGAVKIKLSTGDISLSNMTAGELDLSVSTGKITVVSADCQGAVSIGVSTGRTELSDVRCGSLTSTGSTGNITLKNTVADDSINVKRSTGNVYFENSDASEIFISTSTGDVKGSLLSDKVFLAESDTGRIEVPKTIAGGRCEIVTDTGNIILTVNK